MNKARTTEMRAKVMGNQTNSNDKEPKDILSGLFADGRSIGHQRAVTADEWEKYVGGAHQVILAWRDKSVEAVLDSLLEKKKWYGSSLKGDESKYQAVPLQDIKQIKDNLRGRS